MLPAIFYVHISDFQGGLRRAGKTGALGRNIGAIVIAAIN
jgi:hypothetical protein